MATVPTTEEQVRELLMSGQWILCVEEMKQLLQVLVWCKEDYAFDPTIPLSIRPIGIYGNDTMSMKETYESEQFKTAKYSIVNDAGTFTLEYVTSPEEPVIRNKIMHLTKDKLIVEQ